MTISQIITVYILAFICAIGVLQPRSIAQQKSPTDDNEVLARIGPRTITVQDFVERLELMPWPGKDNLATQDSAKIFALASLVAEKLMSMQAADQGFIQNQTNSSALKALERLFARDELYRLDVLNKISIDPDELTIGLHYYTSTLRLNTFVMDSKENAGRLMQALNSPRDSSRIFFPSEGILSHDTITISFGDLLPSYEDTVYTIDSLNRARVSFAPEYGWAVFQLLEKYTNPSYAKESMPERHSAVQRKLKKRKEQQWANLHAQEFFTNKIQMDSAAFHLLADNLFALMRKDSAGHRQEGFFGIRGDDVDNLNHALASVGAKPFLTMGEYSVSVQEIIDELKFHPVRFSSLRRRSFFQTLNQDIQPIAEAALASQEAMKRGIHQRPEVQRTLNMWVDAQQADKLLKYLIDSLARVYENMPAAANDSLMASPASRTVQTINLYLSRLADKYGAELYVDKLKNVTITPSNMITRRFIGFGGAMMAAPSLPFMWDWLDDWKQMKEISP